MSLTITIPGAVNVTTGSTTPAVLTIGVGVPGATGPQGPTGSVGPQGPQGVPGVAGQGVPTGGSVNQYLVKTSGADFATGWSTLDLSAYATQSFVNAGFAPIGAGVPISGTVGQVLTKNSGTSWDASWQTIIPGDRYLTTSTTSNSVSNGTKTFTIGTGLSYSSQQDVVISHDAANHMHALVTSYNSGTGVLIVNVQSHSGTGTYTSWTVNVGGTTPLQTVEWGEILGTLGDQTDLASALNAKLEITDAASTYQTLSGMSDYLAKAGNLAGLANNATARSNLGLGNFATVNDAPSDGQTYGRNNGAWVVASGGSSPADALTTNQVNAIANASIPNYAAGTSSTLSYSGGLFTFNYLNPDPSQAGGYVSFIADTGYSFTVPSGTTANWEIRFPSGVGETIANLVSWFNSNHSASGSITYAGDDTQSIDGLAVLTSSSFVFQQNTVGSSDTFLISGYIKDYLDKMFFDTSGWQSMLVPVLGVSFPGVSKFLDLSTTFRQTTDNTFDSRIFANGGITSPLVNLPHGFAPGAPVNGDLWSTSSGLFVRINGATQTLGPGTDYRAYTTAGSTTWTKPAGAKWVEIIMFGGGGGGGSGGRYATTSIRTGGGGGAGGPILIAKVAASALGATETVVVGAGGAGGPSTTTDTTLGTSGTQGGSSSFSIFTAAGGGGGAGGGNIGTAPGGLATVGWVTGVTGASSTAGGTAPATNTAGASGGAAGVNSFVATGGGSGSGNIANTTTSNNGGTGGQKNASNTSSGTPLILGGTAGTTAGVAPTTGVAGGGLRGGGTGGGGGAYRTAQAGMAGAVGASPGGGGGGGSASDNGFASGAGGAGGVGAVYIITYC